MKRYSLFITSLFFVLLTLPGSARAQMQSFTFGTAGDFANGNNFHANANQVKADNPAFFLALGDLAYSTVEQQWCSYWKSTAGYNNILLVSGNHDSGESSAGNINTYVQYCPYTLSSTMTGTYGKQYYFDYPASNPIARFIMITPGLKGSYIGLDTDYSIGHQGYTFTQNAIDDARAKGIKWVIVGMHKNYISVLEKSNEVGTDLMNLLFSKRVDLVLQGHEHGYERSKQLTCAKTNTFDATCVADADNTLVKGAGTVIQVLGTGGQGLRGLNTGDSEYPYFMTADNTAYGYGKFTISSTNLSYNFVRVAGGTLSDSYTITDTGTPLPTAGPTATTTPTKAPTPTPTKVPTPTSTMQPTLSPTVANPSPTTTCPVIPTDKGTLTTGFSVANTDTYTVWSRLKAPDTTNNSVYLKIDDACPTIIGDGTLPAQQWTWVDYQDGVTTKKATYALTAGSHTLTIMGKEAGVALDKVIITSDAGCLPSTTGETCVPGTTTTPVVTLVPTATNTPVPTMNVTATPIKTPTPTPTKVPTPTIATATPTPRPTTGTITLHPTDDTFVAAEHPYTNYSNHTTLEVDGDPRKIIYMKFDLAALSGRDVKKAVLRFRVKDSSSSKQYIRFVNNTTWNEKKLTYKNYPLPSTTIATINGGKKDTYLSIDITEAVKTKAGSIFSIRIDSAGHDGLDFYSMQARDSYHPSLIVNY